MNYYLIRSIEAMITPPGLMFVMIITGLLIGNTFARLARGLIFGGLLLLLVVSLPVTSLLIYSWLESDPPLDQSQLEKSNAQAIVILGGGRYPGFEFNKETVSKSALERLRYGAWLHKQTGLPILVTGGSVRGESTSEARLMAETLKGSLGVKPKWIEESSRNTWENALLSRKLLLKKGIDRILLVTHASHMWRSKAAFKAQGFELTPAPLGFKSRAPLTLLHFLPGAHAMSQVSTASHEIIGQLWYTLYY